MIEQYEKFWPLATEQQAHEQAIRLAAAKEYLNERGINAYAVGSTFSYSPSPKVLKN